MNRPMRPLVIIPFSPRFLPACLLLLSASMLAACEEDPVEVVPSLSSIEVTTTTHGDGPAPDFFTVTFNGSPSGNIGRNDQFLIGNVPRGTHLVGLDGIPDNCSPAPKPRLITVEPDKLSYTTFLLRCRPESQ